MQQKPNTIGPKAARKNTVGIIILILLLAPAALSAKDVQTRRQCTRQGEWKERYARPGITVYSQKLPGSNLFALRAEAVLEAPVGQLMEVLRRVDISNEWMPDIRTKYILEVNSDLDVITYSLNSVPFPFSDRELVLRNCVRLDRAQKYLVVDIYSVPYDKHPVKKGAVRSYMHCGEMRVRPITDRKTEIDLLMYVDPRGFIPHWLVNMFQKKLPYNFLKALEKKAGTTDFDVRPQFQQLVNDLEAMMER
ncbi:hypothetical protein D3OALGA1CA_3499 [Olavius algarvensis associated proteobacterium Delta 3]|nr:hypothetical protein D3OALGA1CA_3499 [Olavius algarvensis associated proteobacterium Delta 3]